MIDKHSAPEQQEPQRAILAPQPQEPTPELEFDKMIPPLQQKIELLKKAVGVPSDFDDVGEEEGCGCGEGPEDEISIMLRNAGMNPVVVSAASDDVMDD